MTSFEEANKTVHKVEDQWHYPYMMKGGFTAETKEAVGFVRGYTYKHPSGIVVRCCTGVNADYWEAAQDGKRLDGGYWSDLEPFLKKLSV
jgi:hypothetical protein